MISRVHNCWIRVVELSINSIGVFYLVRTYKGAKTSIIVLLGTDLK